MNVEAKPRFTLGKLLFIVACAATAVWLVTPPWFSNPSWIPDRPEYQYPAMQHLGISKIVEWAAYCLVALPFRLATIAFVYGIYVMSRKLAGSRGR
ncbi:MAG: hypothetical protein SGJ19_02420 [Planctomycetia bacterium]|nr:hypothetical protein [Planctomycetia bacterium]